MQCVTYTRKDGTHFCHPYNTADISDFENILAKIQDDKIRNYTREWLTAAPEYVYTVPASSSGKYHPACDLGEGGLKRHLINTAWMLLTLLEPKSQHEQFSQQEIDIMVSAALLHDLLKCGWQDDFETNPRTRFDHPRLMADAIRCDNTMENQLHSVYRNEIANCVETHMGEWTTSKYHPDMPPLKEPKTEMQKLVHLADYIVSRRNIAIAQNDTMYVFDSQTIRRV